MKAIKMLTALCLISTMFFTACKNDDDSGPQQGLSVENCDDTSCDAKSCATELNVNIKLVECFLESNEDVDWYKFIVTDEDVANGSLNYGFNFINKTENLSIAVDLFVENTNSTGFVTSGNGDGIYEPMEDLTGAVTFLEAGEYYIKISRESGDRDVGAYEFLFN